EVTRKYFDPCANQKAQKRDARSNWRLQARSISSVACCPRGVLLAPSLGFCCFYFSSVGLTRPHQKELKPVILWVEFQQRLRGPIYFSTRTNFISAAHHNLVSGRQISKHFDCLTICDTSFNVHPLCFSMLHTNDKSSLRGLHDGTLRNE